jgi:hypothetical protein
MIHGGADLVFALEPVEEHGVGFHRRVGHFQRDGAAVAEIGGAVDGGHSALGNGRVDAVIVDLLARLNFGKKPHVSPEAMLCDRPAHFVDRLAAVYE